MTEALTPMSIPPRPADGHKGTFGTVLVIGGQCDRQTMMIGSPALTALGALRSGAGRVILSMPRPIMDQGLVLIPSATGCPLDVDAEGRLDVSSACESLDAVEADVQAVAVGPGLGRGVAAQGIVSHLLSRPGPPLVIDADGLNAIADAPGMLEGRRRPCLLTPHPGEYARLADALDLPAAGADPASRIAAAAALALRVQGIVALKGPGTVVSDGTRHWTCDAGSVVLAIPGSGDVLTGMVASLLGQFPQADAASAMAAATWLHGCAGQQWEQDQGSTGMLAFELAEELPTLMQACREGAIRPGGADSTPAGGTL